MANAEKWGAKIKWGDANMLLPNLYMLPALSSQLSVFSKLCIMNTLLHFLLFQLCRSPRNISLDLSQIKSDYHGWLSMMTSSDGPLCSLALAPPTLNSPLAITVPFYKISTLCNRNKK